MRLLTALLTLALSACTVCTTREDEELRAKYAEMERRLEQQQLWVAGCQDDNGALQSAVIELQWGMVEQARITARLRDSCEI